MTITSAARRAAVHVSIITVVLAVVAGCSSDSPAPSEPTTAPNEPPHARISSPENGARYAEGAGVPLAGEAEDPEDGALAGERLRWFSSLDGELGVGEELNVGGLSVGEHVLSLVARDNAGAADTATTGIVIVAVGSLSLTPSGFSLELSGSSRTLDVSVRDADGETLVIRPEDIDWSSTNPAVATLDSQGTVRGTATGQVTITAVLGGTSDHSLATVLDPMPSPEVTLRSLRPASGDIQAVSGTGPNDVWATSRTGGLLHFNGTDWTHVRRADGGERRLQGPRGVWASGPGDVWVADAPAGGTVDDFGTPVTVSHFDGSAWKTFRLGGSVRFGSDLRGIWGTGPNDVWVRGTREDFHYDGTGWSEVDIPVGDGWGVSADDIWGVDGTGILHFDGSAWSRVSSLVARAVWGSGPNDVWAVGDQGSIIHYNGTAWRAVDSPVSHGLTDVFGSSPEDVWAVGPKTILHFDGNGWREVLSPAGALAVWSEGPSDVWAVGADGVILSYDGVRWTIVTTDTGDSDLPAMWGSAPDNVWAGRPDLHFDGSDWHNEADPTGERHAGGLWGSSHANVWSVGVSSGYSVTITRFDGASWGTVYNAVETALGGRRVSGLWGSAPDNVWSVGATNDLVHLRGDVGKGDSGRSSNPTGKEIAAIWGTAEDNVWAVGRVGSIVHFDGMAWNEFPSPTAADLKGIWGSHSDNIWAVGVEGTIIHFDGNSWSEFETPFIPGARRLELRPRTLWAVWGSGVADVWAVGDRGTLVRFDGNRWHRIESPTLHNYLAVWGMTPGDIWIVGEDGQVIQGTR